MYDRRALNISPSLVNLAGSFGGAISKAGDKLVSLGDKKIKNAKADALKKELEAKNRAQMSANNTKNRVLNPTATKRLANVYGIDENSPLYRPGAPSRFNADLGLMDLGKETAPKRKADYTVDNIRYDGETNKPLAITPRAKKTYKPQTPRVIQSYVGQDGYKYTLMSDNKTYKSKNKVRAATSSRQQQKQTLVNVDALTPAQAYYAQIHGLKFTKNGQVLVDTSKLPDTFATKKDTKFGNEEVR